ncbi:MAG: tRNA threonylcarbamoyladenosine dehydratase [Saprospiraceae bacterium]|nr:tRNA threonylcarbamoyladenosine dehydratase [Saprospiraceae bacterium]
MEIPWLERSTLLIGNEATERLANSNILVVGLGGVGSYAADFLVRAGVGKMTIIDGDLVDPTNKNRQLHALDSTVGMPKATLMADRFKDINPNIELTVIEQFMEPDDMLDLLRETRFDYILDCIDSISPKLYLIKMARRTRQKLISAMGAGGKLNPAKIRIADISDTKECKFAQQIKKDLKRDGIKKGLLVVFSEEIQKKSSLKKTDGSNYKKSYYGTISYMPALFGLFMASEVIRRIGKLK